MATKQSDDTRSVYWLYFRPPETRGWRLALQVPLTNIVTAMTIVNVLKNQPGTVAREFSVREDGRKSFRILE
jgi:hypothetical protein